MVLVNQRHPYGDIKDLTSLLPGDVDSTLAEPRCTYVEAILRNLEPLG